MANVPLICRRTYQPSIFRIMNSSKILLLVLCLWVPGMVIAQSPWSTAGNNPNSNSNAFIGTTSPKPLVMKTNAVERLTIDPNGKVLVKSLVATDTSALMILPDGGLARAGDPGNGGGGCNLFLWDGDGNAIGPDCFIGTTNPQPFRIHTRGIERLRVTADGNVVVHGFGAKAAFQVYDHMGITFNRYDVSVADVQRSIGFNLFQDGVNQFHYQTGNAAKMEFVSSLGLLQLSVAQSKPANTQAAFPLGIQLDQYGHAGIGARPDVADALTIGGTVMVQQVGNPASQVRLGHDGANAFVQAVGGNLVLRSNSGTVSVEQSGNTGNHVRLGHDGFHGFIETGGGANARLKVNSQSLKMLEVGGDALFDQYVGIGTTSFVDNSTGKDYRLAVNGRIRAREVKVYSGWADHVFLPDYKLMALADVEAYIAANGHLPGVPSAAEVAQHGVELGANQALLLEKVEELTLHLIRLEKENAVLRAAMEELK
jgi:hypothetical protein